MKSWNEIRKAARKFREFWTLAKDSEVGGYQKFWLSLLGDVLGMDDVMARISFQSAVQLKDTTKFLDAWIPETRVLIEHKARGIKLDAPQAGHGGKTPFEQALEYNIARPFSEKARWIVTCNFLEIWVYDMNHPLEDPQKILLANLPKEISRLGFLVDTSVKTVREKEMDISIKAGRIVGDVYRALRKRYADPDSAETLRSLNRLCVRLVFCFYAEDADIFPKDALWTLLKNTEARNLRRALLTLFRTLDTPDGSNGTKNERDPYLEPEIAVFPYTNGGLFRGVSDAEIPPLDYDIKELLIKSADFDWRDISPTIFGALFESTLNPETRRAGGMVYTSVENIHKVIDPLFMNDLTAELESIKLERAIAVRRAKATAFQEKLGSLTFLDPACGSGNFLTETFLSLRKLENEAIVISERLKPGEVLLNLDGIDKVSIKQFHGIEINDFAVSVAKTAMWISEAKMLNETANILHAPPKYLPLHDYDGIVEGNALRMDWTRIGLPSTEVQIVEVRAGVLFQDAKARLAELKDNKVEVVNSAGDCFRFTKQIFKALSDKARDQSVARSVHWAAVAAIDRLCAASTFLWDEKPRNGSVDIDRYAKHGVCLMVDGVPFVAKITSKVYPGDAAHVTYSVEAVLVEKNDARGMTDSIARGQGLDPSAANRILKFSESVKGATEKRHFEYIMGNPPFVGLSFRTKDQASDMDAVYVDWKDTNYGKLDYVCAWYKKAVDYILATKNTKCTKVAFVSTNSICQGECVAAMWEPMFSRANVEIDFAWRTFRWDNETVASEKAHVHCVIVGFHVGEQSFTAANKLIFVPDPKDAKKQSTIIKADHINGYLLNAEDVFMRNRGNPPDGFPRLAQGNKPWDGGNLILSVKEREALFSSNPDAESFIKRYLGAEDLIKNKLRYCLWLLDVSPEKYRGMPEIMRRLAAVAEIRRKTKTVAVQKQADTPYLFSQIRQPETDYLVVPETSSGSRQYIPVGFMRKDVIASN
ncbi:MAG: class I SAM-dependent DNA methyltransferase, partial [Kiritimatiellae bacterium]|nr:class I SAM-dependent DNA methyltransferase [Kiritimatiellia bacterium]